MAVDTCLICGGSMADQDVLRCHGCRIPFHQSCALLATEVTEGSVTWLCDRCQLRELPFADVDTATNRSYSLSTVRGSMESDTNIAILDESCFNPIELDNEVNNILNDADPDINYYLDCTRGICCNYFLEDTFNAKCREFQPSGDSFSVLHHNVRSAAANLRSLELYLRNLEHKLSAICISETWLRESNAELYSIGGY